MKYGRHGMQNSLQSILEAVTKVYDELLQKVEVEESKVFAGRMFVLERTEDVNGVSDTGHVATGIVFPNEKVAMCWNTTTSSVAVYDSIEDVETIHGHKGRSKVVWL